MVQPQVSIPALRVADLTIDALRAMVNQAGREIKLTPTEHLLLYQLAASQGVTFTHQDFAVALRRDVHSSNMLARHIASLRRKLGDDSEPARYIETVKSLGYRFVS